MWDEIPWICLFVCVLALTQLQFRYCVPCMLNTLKVAEAGVVVALSRLWVQREQLPGFADLKPFDFATHMQQLFKNRTDL